VSLISTVNPDGSANLAPMSSSWYLGTTVVLGISESGQTLPNLRRQGSCVINLPSAEQHAAVERLAPLTGRNPVPPAKRARFRYRPDKFAAAGFTELASDLVAAPRAAQCPVHDHSEADVAADFAYVAERSRAWAAVGRFGGRHVLTVGIPTLSSIAATQSTELAGMHLALGVAAAIILAGVVLIWFGLRPGSERRATVTTAVDLPMPQILPRRVCERVPAEAIR
jgi:hypothetical protein